MSNYTRGQLPRESVPKQGEKPGFVASHDTTGNEDFRRTSPLHPFPVKDADLAAEIEAVKQTQQEILARLDAGLDTRLTGSSATFVNTVSTDFRGWVRGNLSIPHTAYTGSVNLVFDGNRLLNPSPHEGVWTEFTPSKYNTLGNSGNSVKTEALNTGEYACHLFNFNIYQFLQNTGKIPTSLSVNDFKNNLEDFEILWSGWGENGVTLHLWNDRDSNYFVATRSHSESSPAYVRYPIAIQNAPLAGRFIDDSGCLYILVRSSMSLEEGGTSTIYSQHIEVRNIKFKSESIMTDISRVIDDNEKAIQSKIVGNPPAYDKGNDRIKVSVEESTVRHLFEEFIRHKRQPIVVEKLYEGILSSEEFVNDLYSLYRGEKETRILINTDKDSFRMVISPGAHSSVTTFKTDSTFPNTYNYTEAFPDESSPLHVLPITRGSLKVESDTTWEDAYKHRQLNDFRISFRNTSEEEAYVIIRIMRIFQ